MQLHLSLDPDPLLLRIRDRLRAAFGPMLAFRRRDPVSQLVRSILGARTYDAVSEAVFDALRQRFRPWSTLADARIDEVAPLVAPLTYAQDKGHRLIAALSQIRREVGAVRLDFLERWPVDRAMDWLQTLPGVGQKVAASVLNFSTLRSRVFVVDGHVLRVAIRLQLVSPEGAAGLCRDIVMETAPGAWEAQDLTELHVLIKQLGQTFCLFRHPDCGGCPLRDLCAHKPNDAGDEPQTSASRPPPRAEPRSLEPDVAANQNKLATKSDDPLQSYLQRRIAKLARQGVSLDEMQRRAVSLGPAALDAVFAEGGLPPGLHHSAGARGEDVSAALALPLAGVMGAKVAKPARRMLVVQEADARREGGELHGPGLEALGFAPAEAVFVRVRDGPQALQVADEAVRSRAAPAVVLELRRGAGLADLALTRRFNLAARRARMFVYLVTSEFSATSAAATRWRIASAPSCGLRRRLGPPAFHLDLVRNRHGPTGRWLVEWSARERRFLSAKLLFAETDAPGADAAFPPSVEPQPLHRPGAA